MPKKEMCVWNDGVLTRLEQRLVLIVLNCFSTCQEKQLTLSFGWLVGSIFFFKFFFFDADHF